MNTWKHRKTTTRRLVILILTVTISRTCLIFTYINFTLTIRAIVEFSTFTSIRISHICWVERRRDFLTSGVVETWRVWAWPNIDIACLTCVVWKTFTYERLVRQELAHTAAWAVDNAVSQIEITFQKEYILFSCKRIPDKLLYK